MNKKLISTVFLCIFALTSPSYAEMVCCTQEKVDICKAAGGILTKRCEYKCPGSYTKDPESGMCCKNGKDTKGNATAECCKASGGVLLTNIGPELKTKCCDCSASMGQNIPECHGI